MTRPGLALKHKNPGWAYIRYRSEIDEAIRRVLEGGNYVLGREVEAFEKEFARYIGVRQAVGVANGTDAIELSLRALNIGEGDLVLTVSHTAIATIAGIVSSGATPVFVDVDPQTYLMDPESLSACIQTLKSKKWRSFGVPRAILVVHLYGLPANLETIIEIGRANGLAVIEDCAQAHGAKVAGARVGSIGTIASFSFYPTKNLAAFGDGGMVTTNDDSLADRVALLREYGWRDRSTSVLPGRNSRLDELQAAILRTRLRHLDGENDIRRDLAKRYDDSLPRRGISLPLVPEYTHHVYHQYAIKTQLRSSLVHRLGSAGIPTAIHYPLAAHQQPGYEALTLRPIPLPNTESLVDQIVSLPLHPGMSHDEVTTVCDEITGWVENSQ